MKKFTNSTKKNSGVVGSVNTQTTNTGYNAYQTGHGRHGEFRTRNSKGSEKNLAKKEIRSYGF